MAAAVVAGAHTADEEDELLEEEEAGNRRDHGGPNPLLGGGADGPAITLSNRQFNDFMGEIRNLARNPSGGGNVFPLPSTSRGGPFSIGGPGGQQSSSRGPPDGGGQNGGGGRDNKKLPVLSDNTPTAWRCWLRNFKIICRINKWSDLRMRQELASSMTGLAAASVSNLEAEPVDDYGRPLPYSIDELIAAYHDRFIPEAECELAQHKFRGVRQMEQETVLAFHVRVRDLYAQAEPTKSEDSKECINAFALGLAEDSVRERLWEERPKTYNEVLVRAGNLTAAKATMLMRKMEDKGQYMQSLNAINMTEGTGPLCWTCGGGDHLQRQCPRTPVPARAPPPRAPRGPQAPTAWRGGPGPGQSPFRPRTGGRGRRPPPAVSRGGPPRPGNTRAGPTPAEVNSLLEGIQRHLATSTEEPTIQPPVASTAPGPVNADQGDSGNY